MCEIRWNFNDPKLGKPEKMGHCKKWHSSANKMEYKWVIGAR